MVKIAWTEVSLDDLKFCYYFANFAIAGTFL